MSTEMPRPADRSVIAILLVAAFVVILNETTMNVALPPHHGRPARHRALARSG